MTDIVVTRRRVETRKQEPIVIPPNPAINNRHWEVFTTVDLQSEADIFTGRTVVVTFTSSFVGTPVGVSTIKLWRVIEEATGVFVITDVLNFRPVADWFTQEGFTLEIASHEDLTGIHFEYMITEM